MATIQLLNGAEKIKDSYGKINTSLTNINNELTGHIAKKITDSGGVHGLIVETGIFTPDLKFGGNNVGMTYTNQFGRYTRIGNIIYWAIDMALSAKGSSTGNATIEGLPFTSITSVPVFTSFGVIGSLTYPSNVTGVQFVVLNNDNKITLRVYGNGVLATQALTDSAFANNSQIRASGFYFI